MNCERCKSKRASLFFIDENQAKRAFCAECGASYGRTASFSPTDVNQPTYLPSPSLSFMAERPSIALYLPDGEDESSCDACGSTLSDLKTTGQPRCPACYSTFSKILIPIYGSPSGGDFGRMPASRRRELDRQRSIRDLKQQLTAAIGSENFELAAILRDKIKKLESTK